MHEGICQHTELEIHATGSKAAPSTGSEMVKHLPLRKKTLQGGMSEAQYFRPPYRVKDGTPL